MHQYPLQRNDGARLLLDGLVNFAVYLISFQTLLIYLSNIPKGTFAKLSREIIVRLQSATGEFTTISFYLIPDSTT